MYFNNLNQKHHVHDGNDDECKVELFKEYSPRLLSSRALPRCFESVNEHLIIQFAFH
jgi:hypothetical protein